MSRKAKKYLFDIAQSITDILETHLKGIESYEEYEMNKTVRRAISKELEIIGEAARRLQQMEIHLSQSDALINRRNTLIHQYDDFKDETIWRYIHDNLHLLKLEIDQLMSEVDS